LIIRGAAEKYLLLFQLKKLFRVCDPPVKPFIMACSIISDKQNLSFRYRQLLPTRVTKQNYALLGNISLKDKLLKYNPISYIYVEKICVFYQKNIISMFRAGV